MNLNFATLSFSVTRSAEVGGTKGCEVEEDEDVAEGPGVVTGGATME